MTRKDYVLLAEGFRIAKESERILGFNDPTKLAGIDMAARHVAGLLAMDNPRFDRERFLIACGVTR